MHLFQCEATFEADPAEVWKVWIDVARWPEWDPSKEIAQLDGPFQPGVSGWAKQRGNLGGAFTVTEVDDGRGFVTECPMPLGKVVFGHFLEPVTGGRVRVVKRVDVQGAFGSLLRLVVPMMRRQIDESLLAMGRRCPHRAEQPPPDEIGGRRRTG
jgi:Polyketide cyclase / dehydrase and lipid transport